MITQRGRIVLAPAFDDDLGLFQWEEEFAIARLFPELLLEAQAERSPRATRHGDAGTWICSQCGAGYGIELVKRFLNVEFKEEARLIEQHIGAVPILSSGKGQMQTDAQKRGKMISLWKRSRLISHDDAAGRYLNARTGLTTFPSCLRFSPDERSGSTPSWHPALIAKVDPCDKAVANGERAALHRTYLDGFGFWR